MTPCSSSTRTTAAPSTVIGGWRCVAACSVNRERLGQYALLLALFLLPWQLREIFTSVRVDGQMWEYGTGSLYATQLLVLLAVILRGGFRIDRARAFVGPVAIVVLAAIVSAATSPVPMSSLALVFQAGLGAGVVGGAPGVRLARARLALVFHARGFGGGNRRRVAHAARVRTSAASEQPLRVPGSRPAHPRHARVAMARAGEADVARAPGDRAGGRPRRHLLARRL